MTDNIIKRSRTETRKAELAATSEVFKWRAAELAMIEELRLEGNALTAAMGGLNAEMTKRLKAGKSRAKSQNTVTKLIEREIRDEKERDRAARPE
jgi:hypothetical protein